MSSLYKADTREILHYARNGILWRYKAYKQKMNIRMLPNYSLLNETMLLPR